MSIARQMMMAAAGAGGGAGEAWSLAGASYDGVRFILGAGESNPSGMAFKPDGTKMYVVGYAGDAVYQFTLSTPWDMTTALYDGVSFSVAGQEIVPTGLSFKGDTGNRMFVVGQGSDRVYQYALLTPWDLSTAVYDNVSFSVTPFPRDVQFKPDGTKMFTTDIATDSVYRYGLNTAWNLFGGATLEETFSVSSQAPDPSGIFLKPDGDKLYVIDQNTKSVYQYSLGTPWSLATASYDGLSFAIGAQESSPTDVSFKPDGVKMYVLGLGTDSVYQYSLTD